MGTLFCLVKKAGIQLKEKKIKTSDLIRISNLIETLEESFENPKNQWCFLHFLEKTLNESADGYVKDCQEIYFDKEDGHFHSRFSHYNGGNMFDQHTWGNSFLSSVGLLSAMNNEKSRLRSIYCYEDDATFEADFKKLTQMLIGWERIR